MGYLFSNKLKDIDLSPLKHCSKLTKLSLCNNFLTKIDLTPLQNCKELKVLWLHNNDLDTINLSSLAKLPELKRIGLDKSTDLVKSNIPNDLIKILEFINEEPSIRESINSKQMEYDDFDNDYYDNDYSERSLNDQRSDVMNPNNPEYKDNVDNKSDQMNPNNPAYNSSRKK